MQYLLTDKWLIFILALMWKQRRHKLAKKLLPLALIVIRNIYPRIIYSCIQKKMGPFEEPIKEYLYEIRLSFLKNHLTLEPSKHRGSTCYFGHIVWQIYWNVQRTLCPEISVLNLNAWPTKKIIPEIEMYLDKYLVEKLKLILIIYFQPQFTRIE